ncbi:helix-turn-helix transcriptional regulator [Leucobacter sp. HY1910]
MENSLPPIEATRPHTPRVAASGRTHSATRETLLRLIEAQPEAVTIAQLATASGCHENTVRGHVHALWRDGFLDRELAEAAGKGRPSWLWRAAAGSSAQADSPYAGLAMALADGLAATGDEAPDRARAVGLAWGRTLAAELPRAASADDARRTVIAVMQEQGFAPRADTSEARVLLKRCPLVAAAVHRPEIVCAVHLGMVEGALEAIGARDAGSTLTPMTGPGECTLELRVRS